MVSCCPHCESKALSVMRNIDSADLCVVLCVECERVYLSWYHDDDDYELIGTPDSIRQTALETYKHYANLNLYGLGDEQSTPDQPATTGE